jgi:hypothetical protein
MSSMRGLLALTLAVMSPAAAGYAAPPPAAPIVVPVDRETTVNGVQVACTVIGSDARAEPRWQAYGVRVEFSNARNEYLTGGALRLRDHAGRDLLGVSCDAPWILLRLADGAYQVEGWLPEANAKPRSARFTTPTKTQLRVVLQFPEL